MKAVILAGGYGTRLSEETDLTPKPLVEIGERPILWHILKSYSAYGINDFIICCGYKSHAIKKYFADYFLYMSDVTFDMSDNSMKVHHNYAEPWKVTLVDTGADTMTGGRLKRVSAYLQEEEAFCFTYGDGVSDVDISKLISFHKSSNREATVMAAKPPGRFGALEMLGDRVVNFQEKPQGDGGYINAGFFVLNKSVLDLIEDDQTFWEKEPLETLAANGQLNAYIHDGFWQCMDTLRDKKQLESLWQNNKAPWKVWK